MDRVKIEFTDLKQFTHIELLSHMICPDDDTLRRQFLASKLAATLIEATTPVDGPAWKQLTEILIDAPSRDGLEKIRKNRQQNGEIAGHIISIFLAIANESVEEASLEKCFFIVEDYYRKSIRTPTGEAVRLKNRKIKTTWSTYKSVSHLWAAHNLASILIAATNITDFHLHNPLWLTSAAKIIGDKFNQLYANKHTKQNLSPAPSFLVIPDELIDPKVNIAITKASPYHKELLNKYRSPI